MPLYEYKCSACSRRFERLERVTAPTVRACPECGSPSQRQLGAPALQFKGSGWYVTDYARGNGSNGGGTEASAKSEKPAESKSETSSGGTKDTDGSKSGGSSAHQAA